MSAITGAPSGRGAPGCGTTATATRPATRSACGPPPLVTCSVGLAWRDLREASADLLARADQALYLGRAEGRNRDVLAS